MRTATPVNARTVSIGPGSGALAKTMLDIGNNLNIRVVATGVEEFDSRDRSLVLVRSYSDVLPGSFYLLDTRSGKMEWLVDQAPWMAIWPGSRWPTVCSSACPVRRCSFTVKRSA